MLMFSLKRMRVYNNHPVHHMRMGKQSNSSQINYEQQRKEESHYLPQLLQNSDLFQMRCEDKGSCYEKQELFHIIFHKTPEYPHIAICAPPNITLP